MDDSRYLLWLGSVFDEPTMLENPAVSAAANHWERGLVSALQALDVRVIALGHLPEPVWPKGRARIGQRVGTNLDSLDSHRVSYWNLPLLRRWALHRGYLADFDRVVAVYGAPAAVITYNPYSYNAAVGSRARDRLGVPWFCIVADGIGPGSRAYAAAADRADGRVFLPWSGYQACEVEPNLHLDGGVGTFRGHAASVPARTPRVVLYAGRMTRSNGVELLADAFGELSQRDVELWFCGKGRSARVEAAARRDARVKVLGAVTESRLTELSRTAYVFVNPRLSDVPGNAMLFPSKLLRYLAYGKPVVSTWTEGLAPEYRSILRIPSDETPAGLAASIDDVLGWDAERVEELRLRIGRFIDGRLWSVQAKRLVGWMEEHSP